MNTIQPSSCNTTRRSLLIAAGLAGLGTAPGLLAATRGYPDHPVRIILPGPPGLALDIVVRVVADALGAKYNQSFIVEDRPGAGGMVAMQMYANNYKPDGYTLLAGGLGPSVMIASLFKNVPLDPYKAFIGVGQMAESANILVVRADLPYQSVAELVAAAKARPNEIKVGSNDIGSSMQMSYELFAQRTGTQYIYAPYRGPNEVMGGLLSETIDVGFSSFGPFVPTVKSGKLRALAVTTSYRQDMLPDVPTMQEAGVHDYDVGSWLCLHALPGTPAAIIDQLGRDMVEIVNRPEIGEKLKAAGYMPRPLEAKAFQEKWAKEMTRWTAVAQNAHLVKDYQTGT
ncbi:MAG TPA: tripartite tricarboxylate transporter substrate binding protein [Bordetella sp.]